MSPNTSAGADRIEAEHHALGQEASALHELMTEPDRQRVVVQERLLQFAEHVSEHFENEERGGYFSDAVKKAPHLSSMAAKLEEQHEPLLESLQALTTLARAGVESEAWWDRIAADFDRLAQQLQQHELGERSLLQRAYGQDIGSGD